MFGLIVFRAQRALLLQIVMTQLSCRRAPPQNTVFKGCKQVVGACRKDECEHGCCASKESPKWHFKNNGYVCSSLHSPPTPECYSGDSGAKTSVTVISFKERQV